jgi:hypothetical protein
MPIDSEIAPRSRPTCDFRGKKSDAPSRTGETHAIRDHFPRIRKNCKQVQALPNRLQGDQAASHRIHEYARDDQQCVRQDSRGTQSGGPQSRFVASPHGSMKVFSLALGGERYLLSFKRCRENHACRRTSVRQKFFDEILKLCDGRKYDLQQKCVAAGEMMALLNGLE